MGVITRFKGIENLIEAMCMLPEEGFTLLAAGAGDESYLAELKRMAGPVDVQFVGKIPATEFMCRLDVLVVPSVWPEPFGRVVVEAYSCGVPVVASRTGGLSELVYDGKTGFLVNPSDSKQLADALSRFSRNWDVPLFNPEHLIAESRRYELQTAIDRYSELQRLVVNEGYRATERPARYSESHRFP